MQYKTFWQDPRSIFNDEIIHGKRKIWGTIFLDDIQFTFSLVQQKSGAPYEYRGRATMLSLHDGSRTQLQGSARKKVQERIAQKRGDGDGSDISKHESFVIDKAINLHEADTKTVKQEIEAAVLELYNDYGMVNNTELRKLRLAQLSPGQMIHLHLPGYMATKGVNSNRTNKRIENRIRTVFQLLGTCRVIADISTTAIKKIVSSLGPENNLKLREAAKFWDWVVAKTGQYLDNPFAIYVKLNRAKVKSSPRKNIKRALTLKSLPEDIEKKLNTIIAEAKPEDNKTTFVLLAKETGQPFDMCKTFMWKNILWDSRDNPQTAILNLHLNDINGATHNRLVPLSIYATGELWRRYTAAIEATGKSSIPDMQILSSSNILPTKKQATEACRSLLLQAGISRNNLALDRTEPYGVGVRLLINNYNYRCSYICGVEDKGTLRYIKMDSLAGCVTDDHYRCYTDADGQYYLRGILGRDGRFIILTDREIEAHDNEDGTVTTVVPATEADKLTVAYFEYILQPGEELCACVDYGSVGHSSATLTRKLRKKSIRDECKDNTDDQLSFLV